ncbi:Uncharacterised protein [Cedecea davisae]|uniref:Uncharacterized protein n=2 Tax=Cedecea davisae TaxID=158484 RepID=S3J3S0_9ENTR|nr:hypothetical protein HMPREF0201_00230 [Cedecea davisae DSM 4568]SUX36700.1 Uncharacterised protein [Cedecea davisae]
MPVLIPGESKMAVYPISYSPAALERAFDVSGTTDILGPPALIVLRKDKSAAAIIYAEPVLDENDELRHPVVAKLDLIPRKSARQNESIVAVKRYWESKAVSQVEGIVVDNPARDTRVATTLYEHLIVEQDLILMSDHEQYIGGQAIWKRIARSSKDISVFILDTESGCFYPYDGERVCYDSECIPESEIWSLSPDESQHGIVLVAEKRTSFSVDEGLVSQA